ncbi:hypothetical protein BZG36_05673, partial [Bifiguratus adelaidae]
MRVDTDRLGKSAYNWNYNPTSNSGEDSNHGSLDVAGFYRAYATNRYGYNTAQMTPFGNMVCDVLTGTVGSYYHGRVDGTDGTGHAASTTYLRSGYFFTAEFRPDQYYNMVSGLHITAPGTTTSIDGFSSLMWIKNKRFLGSANFTLSVTPASQSVAVGSSTSFTVSITATNGFTGTVNLGVSGLPTGASGSFSPTSITGGSGSATLTISTSSSTAAGSYNLAISGTSGTINHTTTATLVVNANPVSAPIFSPGGGTFTSSQSVTITSATSGASIRYTTDGSTPSSTVGALYSSPVSIASTTMLKAIAYKSGMSNSTVTSATYTISSSTTSTTLNDTASGIVYTGTWNYGANRGLGDYQDDIHFTATNGDSVAYTFTGTGIDYVTEKNSDEGNVDVYIDGVLQQTVSCVSTTRLAQQTAYSNKNLTPGSHTLKLVKKDGTYMILDALVVYNSSQPPVTFTISASAAANGTISPSGTINVSQGANQTFAITPNSGYVVSTVTVDGNSTGAATTYTFSNVQANHTISATFIAAPANTNIAPSGTAYGWSGMTSATVNTGRVALPGLNDNNLTTNVDIQPAGDNVGAWEAAGVIWTSAKTISSAKFINGDVTSSGDGFLTANCTLHASASGRTYTFSGAAVSGKLGARVVGQVRTADTSYHWIVKEVIFIGSTSLSMASKCSILKDNHTSPKLEYFIQELPIPPITKPFQSDDGDHEPRYRMSLDLITHKFHPKLPPTIMYGFNGMHPGPTIEAQTDKPIKVDWINNLPLEPHPLGFAIDPTIDRIDGLPDVRNTIHLHGAHVLNTSDGRPTSWVTPGTTLHYRYPNQQEPATMWYHDHALGITRLNVYAGLVGFYLLRTPGLDEKLGLPTGEFDIPLVLQDKFFNNDGSLYYPTIGHGHNPVWVSDLEADTPVVNGKVAPYLKVEPRKYRFRILNGANYREWNLYLKEDNLNFTQIGADGGFLPEPVVVREVPLGVAERADVIVDFTPFKNKSVFLRNNAPRHESDFSLPKLMRFDVLSDVKSKDKTTIPSELPFRPAPTCIYRNRTMTLSEPDEVYLLNNPLFLGPVDTHPVINTTEIWRIINLTNETHPVHIHLGEFKLLKRCPFETERWLEDNKPDDIEPYIKGPCGHHHGVLPGETGHKDVFRHFAHTVTIIKLPFLDYTGVYVMHCHKLEHEDNDMMNPWEAVKDTGDNKTCIDYVSGTLRNFLISIPSTYSQQSQVPIILSYHGGTKTAQHQLELDQLTNPQFNTFAMVVYPQGLHDTWENIPGRSENVPDVQFTADIIDHLSDLYCIDRNRIWATGKSDGGGLCGTLACDPNLSKRIAAFAPVSGAFYVKSSTCKPSTANPPCNPGRSNIPFIEFHGGNDRTIAYNGGPRHGECLTSIPHYIQQWAIRNGLGSNNQSVPFAPDSVVYSFGTGGNAGLVAQYYDPVIDHDWP